jgi:hypothetical protein
VKKEVKEVVYVAEAFSAKPVTTPEMVTTI